MEHRKFGNTDLMASTIGLGCYGMSGVYGAADDMESIATIRRALDLGANSPRDLGQLRARPQSSPDRRSHTRPPTRDGHTFEERQPTRRRPRSGARWGRSALSASNLRRKS
jgi:hypothetical protein